MVATATATTGTDAASMFTLTDPDADYLRLQRLSSTEVDSVAESLQRDEYRLMARKVFAANRIAEHTLDEMIVTAPITTGYIARQVDKTAASQVAIALNVPPKVAREWMWLALALADWPGIRAAFLDGRWSFSRTSIMVAELAVLTDPEVRAFAEVRAIALADRPTAERTLRNQIAEMVIALDPDAAAERRKDFAESAQNVTVTDEAHGHVNVHATVPAEVGLFLACRIRELITERVCSRDPRPLGRLRVEALKEIQGMPGESLQCACGDEFCSRGIPLPPVPQPDPELDLDYAPRAESGADPVPNPPRDQRTTTPPIPQRLGGSDPAPEHQSPRLPVALVPPRSPITPRQSIARQSSLTVITDPAGIASPRLVGYGAIDPQHWHDIAAGQLVTRMDAPELDLPELDDPGVELAAIGRDLAAWQTVDVGADRGPAPPVDPTGHGGYAVAPRGALRYRPPEWLRDKVVALDKICRYPGCGRDASACELDHVVKFDHADPASGGWTVEFNLMPLCRADHQRKHLGLWIPTMLTDRAIVWRNPLTGKTVTTFPG
ncbi:HNH endonuclease signature motif containing protein [Gordonia sp. NB41Y]|uniref:HNH endonuclease signature motif containing protein n=1 Tax=Gordonia sp. NB41Y TaxID=875808 RepID=UPI00034B2D43|nr:HNH endonuclease signature motif containing protein [Gordonia sp. NB41Y]WLP88991.1 HNH endonuclease [Gordonia sp. NB41Y]